MQYIIYSALSLAACILGSISGMGGGVIIKPVMDLIGDFDAVTISLLSSLTVFSMSIVSLIKSKGNSGLENEPWSSPSRLLVLGLGGVVGGYIGQFLFTYAVQNLSSTTYITVIQNAILLLISIIIFFFLIYLNKIRLFKFRSYAIYVGAGIFLGIVSSFLGIGGGAINVAILMYLFSFDMKTAVFSSLLVIFFSQLAKLCDVLLNNGFVGLDLSIAPFMIISAITAGFIGTAIKKRSSNATVTKLFNAIQVLIMIICIVNIVKSM